jgi:hypothetical protein
VGLETQTPGLEKRRFLQLRQRVRPGETANRRSRLDLHAGVSRGWMASAKGVLSRGRGKTG